MTIHTVTCGGLSLTHDSWSHSTILMAYDQEVVQAAVLSISQQLALLGALQANPKSHTSDELSPDDDGLGDLNPLTVNYNYGTDEINQNELAIAETVVEPNETKDNAIDMFPDSQDPPATIKHDLQVQPEVLDQGATTLRHSQCARSKPQ